MKKPKIRSLYLAGLLASSPVWADNSLFEDFSAPLNMDKFWGMEEVVELDTVNENVRFEARGQAYTRNSRASNLALLDSSVGVFQADLMLSEASLSNAETQQALLALAGVFYNSDSANPTSEQGEVFVRVAVGDRGNGLEAWYELQVATAPGWETGTITEASLGAIELETAYTASISYDGDDGFTIVFDNGEAIQFDGPPRLGEAYEPSRFINNRLRFGQDNATPTLYDGDIDVGEPASIVGTVDNVVTEDGLIDDFSGDDIDLAVWANDQTSVAVDDGGLVMKVTGQGEQITERFWIKQKGLKEFGADVTLLGSSTVNDSTRVRGRLTHYLGNDTYDIANGDTPNGWEGFLWTQFLIERAGGDNRAVVYAERARNADWSEWDELFWIRIGDINLDQSYSMLIRQTGTFVEYLLDGNVVHSFDLASDHSDVLSGDVYEPIGDTESGLQTRVQNDAGHAHVRFDNVVTDHVSPSVELNAFDEDDSEVAYPAEVVANEGEVIDLAADVSDPGQVAAYIWEQVAGPDVEVVEERFAQRMVGSDATLSFTVPAGADTETLEFELTVVDRAGVASNQQFAVRVDNSATSTLAPSSSNPSNNNAGGSSSGGGGGGFMHLLVGLGALLMTLLISGHRRRAG